MTVIRSLDTRLSLNSAEFRRGMRQARTSMSSFQKKSADFSKKARAGFVALSKSVTSFRGAIAALATGAVMYKLRQTYATLDEIAHTGANLSLTNKQWYAFAQAAQWAGGSAENLGDVLKDLNVKITNAAVSGSGSLVDFFDRIGESAQTWQQLNPSDQLKRFTAELQKMSEAEARFWLDEVNDSASRLFETLIKSNGQIFKFTDEIEKLGLSLTSTQFDSIRKTHVDLMRTTSVLKSMWHQLAAAAAPAVRLISMSFREWILNAAKLHGGMNNLMRDLALKSVDVLESATRGVETLVQKVQHARTELRKFFDIAYIRNKLLFGSDFADFMRQQESGYKEAQELFKVDQSVFNSYDTLRAKIKTLSHETIQQHAPKPFAPPRLNTLIKKDSGLAAETQKLRVHLQRQHQLQQAHANREQLEASFRLEDKLLSLEQQYQSEAALLKNNLEAKKQLEANYATAQRLAQQEHQLKLESIERESAQRRKSEQNAVTRSLLSNTASNFSNITSVMQNAGKEQSGIYKTLFAMQKAFVIPSMIMDAHMAANKARATYAPPWGEFLANATLASAMASVGIVAAQGLTGMAHDGIHNVPKEGTWLLDKGERVLNNKNARQLDSMQHALEHKQHNTTQVIVNVENRGTHKQSLKHETHYDAFNNAVVSIVIDDLETNGPISQRLT